MKEDPKTILITGGNSGIGYQAVKKMINDGHKLIIPCRNYQTSEETLQSLIKYLPPELAVKKKASFPLMDLSDLSNISNFCEEIYSEYKHIDTLILNAGLQYTGAKNPKWSKQGFELTFAVNHLAHHFLCSKILPLLCKSNTPRIVVTSSDVHNPETSGGRIGEKAYLGSMLGIKTGKGFSMVDGNKTFSADKAYKDSKLCNILFAKELFNRISNKGIQIPIIAWAPGLVIPRDTKGFFRYSRTYNEIGQRIFSILARDILRISETVLNAGNLLARLSTSDEYNIKSFNYYSNHLIAPGKFLFKKGTLSKEAQMDELSGQLWALSDQLISKELF